MATVTDNMRDAADRHTVYMLRWSRSTYRRHSKLIDELVADLAAQLSSRAPSDMSFTARRLRAMLDAATRRSKEMFDALESAVVGDYRSLAEYESEFQISAIQSAYPIEMSLASASPAKIHAAAMSQPFQGRVLRDWLSNQEYATQQAFKSALRLGFAEDESIQQIARRLRGVGDMTKRQVEAVVRTATNHMAQVARSETVEANKELFAYEEWSSTLDGRTTAICRARDGKRYEVGKGPKPPAHFGCRSARIPVTKSWKELGFDDLDDDESVSERPFVADTRSVKDIPKSARSAIIGTTTERSYNEWLRTQPRGFVEDVLGKQKAALYLDGGLTLDKFVDRVGDELTLDQIRDRESKAYAEAWKKAFGE